MFPFPFRIPTEHAMQIKLIPDELDVTSFEITPLPEEPDYLMQVSDPTSRTRCFVCPVTSFDQ